MSSAVTLLGPDGPLAKMMLGYEARPGQLEMAEAVERALDEDHTLLCEAGTGTGKTLAYLIPAILSGKKIIISTATRALQTQIFERDLPLIERALGITVEATVMKGLSNYLCRRRYRDFAMSAESLRPRYATALNTLGSWIDETDSGDIAELAALSEADPIWRETVSGSDTRVGPDCAYYGDCFVTRMKREAESARIVIVNHHLFFADLALRGPHPGHVIPDYDAVIFDEAHRLEDIATDFFSSRLGTRRLDKLLNDAERAFSFAGGIDSSVGSDSGGQLIGSARTASEAFEKVLFESGGSPAGRVALDDRITLALTPSWYTLDNALEGVAAYAAVVRGKGSDSADAKELRALTDALDVVSRRASTLRDDLRIIVEGAPGRVTWLERTRRDDGKSTFQLSSSPVDISSLLEERLFDLVPACILTSATLASGSSKPKKDGKAKSPYRFLRSRLGLTSEHLDVRELIVESPFDFATHAMLYTPDDLPAPNHPDFTELATERIVDLVRMTDGGCFVLTTSLRSMRAFHQSLKAALPERAVTVQGAAPKNALIGAFRAAEDSVLVATMSFWEGVDVPGRALRLVVLEKLPFPVPSDPIVQARGKAIEEQGGNAFMEFHVPTAKITLKQGFGRLIRSRTDVGVVALLDDRVHRRSYGKSILRGLPPARRTLLLEDVDEFWKSHLSTGDEPSSVES